MSNWQRLNSKIVYQNSFFTVHEDQTIDPIGKPITYGWVETPPAVFVVPIDEHGRVVLIKQLRYVVGQPSWSLPSGHTDGDSEEGAANRKLIQEAGLTADKWIKLQGEHYAFSAMATQRNAVFIARDLHKTKNLLPVTDNTILGTEAFTWKQLKDMIKNGELNNGETIAALTVAGLHLGRLK